MYLVHVEVKDSAIDGKGVFATEPAKRGAILWKFDSSHDKSMSVEDFQNLSDTERAELQRVAYLSQYTNRWVYPPENDPALFTNHNPGNNNMSVIFDKNLSDEPIFVANRDINAAEELTNNYLEFDARPEKGTAGWI